jgi:hypothetical protein
MSTMLVNITKVDFGIVNKEDAELWLFTMCLVTHSQLQRCIMLYNSLMHL